MTRSSLLAALAALAVAGATPASALAPSSVPIEDVFPAIPAVRAVHGVARVDLHVVVDPVTGYPAFEWGTRLGVAPTIRVHPGEAIEMTVRNDMRPFGGRADNVNVHFHGLMVAPRAPGDETLATLAAPGHTLRYRVAIPRTHPPGLFWYHPHAHGESYYAVTNGMSGAIVIEGIERRIPMLAMMRERVVVLRDVPSGPGFLDDDMPMTGTHDAARGRVIGRPGTGPPCRPETGLQPTLNRQSEAHIAIRPGERQFFRVVNGAAARVFDLAIDGAALDVVALDGVPIAAVAGNAVALRRTHLLLPPGGRAEFVVTAPAGSTVLRSRCVDTGSAGDPAPAVVLARLEDPARAPGQEATSVAPGTTAPAALRAAPGAPAPGPLPQPAQRRTIRFTENAHGFFINGAAYVMGGPPLVTARSGTVEEWTVENATDEVHAFHIHQVHFLTESVDGGQTPRHVWLDTVNVPPRRRAPDGRFVNGAARLLLDFRDPLVRGTFPFHCHILDHEDQGMMATIQVI